MVALKPKDMTYEEKRREREVVKEAERAVDRQWHTRGATIMNGPEFKAWKAWKPGQKDYPEHPRAKAQRLARAFAREDFRMQLARERAARATPPVEYPSHITRIERADGRGRS